MASSSMDTPYGQASQNTDIVRRRSFGTRYARRSFEEDCASRRLCRCSTDEIGKNVKSTFNDKDGCIDVEECEGIFNVVILKDKNWELTFPNVAQRYVNSNAVASETQAYTECGCNGTLEKRPDDKENVVEDRIRSIGRIRHY